MKMKNLFVCLLAFWSVMFVVSCSDDKMTDELNKPSSSEGVYVSVQVAMPNASNTGSGLGRSFTDGDNSSNGGVEVGKDEENSVNNILLVLATTDNEYITHGQISTGLTPNAAGTLYSTKTKVSKTALEAFYTKHPATAPGPRDIRVFVFCNPTEELTGAMDGDTKDWTNFIYKVTDPKNKTVTVWEKDNFLMSNRDIATRAIPATLEDWSAYDENNPFKLSGENKLGTSINNGGDGKGAIRVERSVARFDFKDGSEGGNNTYPVVMETKEEGSEETPVVLVNMQLGKMALVNMNNSFYYLRRVSADGLDTDAEICGAEKPWYSDATGKPMEDGTGNYVVDVYAQEKHSVIKAGFDTYFYYPFFNQDGKIDNTNVNSNRWDTYLISDVVDNGETDNPEWDGAQTHGDYKIWRYVTENTIPEPDENQTNGQTTGIVFKGKMIATPEAVNSDDENTRAIATTINNNVGESEDRDSDTDPIIYYFNGRLYHTWENIRKAADKEYEATKNLKAELVKAVYGNDAKYDETSKKITGDENSADAKWNAWKPDGVEGEPVEANRAAFKAAATGAGIALYQSSYDKQLGGWGYYCYYYYWNRHNDNGVNGVMGPMEFAVVRNNVYKLAVTKISRLGHPRISENDPDEPTPETPDEKGDVYLSVSVEILPWVVRVNNIEF